MAVQPSGQLESPSTAADPQADWGWREHLLFKLCVPPPAKAQGVGSESAGKPAASLYRPGAQLERFTRRFPGVSAETFRGRHVIDFGSGEGDLVLDLAGVAREAIGLEIRPEINAVARQRAQAAGVEAARFLLPHEFDPERDRADYIISTDAMEHFGDVGEILRLCAQYLKPGGRMLAAFSPIWMHPRGHHMSFMCRLPWFHLFFPERAVMNVRRLYRGDGARRFSEISGGLGCLTLRKFHRHVAASPFRLEKLSLTPIRRTGLLAALPGMQEFLTADVACILKLPDSA